MRLYHNNAVNCVMEFDPGEEVPEAIEVEEADGHKLYYENPRLLTTNPVIQHVYKRFSDQVD